MVNKHVYSEVDGSRDQTHKHKLRQLHVFFGDEQEQRFVSSSNKREAAGKRNSCTCTAVVVLNSQY